MRGEAPGGGDIAAVPGRARAGRKAAAIAVPPLVVTVAAVLIVAEAGLTQASTFGTVLEDRTYGFFFDRYPVFLFAVVYGAARIVTVAVAAQGQARWLRWLTAPLAVALLLAVSFHPTFGGLVLRAGFVAGGMTFLQGYSVMAAFLAGTAVSSFAFGLALGAGVAHVPRTWAGLLDFGRFAIVSTLALWAGSVVLAAPRALGFDLTAGWPSVPLTASSALVVALWMTVALGPHAAAVAWRVQALDP